MGHVQAMYKFPSLTTEVCINILSIQHISGSSYDPCCDPCWDTNPNGCDNPGDPCCDTSNHGCGSCDIKYVIHIFKFVY